MGLLVLSGCVSNESVGAEPFETSPGIQVTDREGRGIAFAAVAIYSGADLSAISSTGGDGRLADLALPSGATRLVVSAPGYLEKSFDARHVPSLIVLDAAQERPTSSALRFVPPVELRCGSNLYMDLRRRVVDACGGFGEPVIEIAGDGTIWASASCCAGSSPPIWISRDDGKTFRFVQETGTGQARELLGTEGEFAIDKDGNVYFFDITVATGVFTSWRADGTHRWTTLGPMAPPVDRPWVRAGAPNEVYIIYNDLVGIFTPGATYFQASSDGGLTWDPTRLHRFPCRGMFGQGPERDDLIITGVYACVPNEDTRDPRIHLWLSKNGGRTWSADELVPLPEGKFRSRGIHVALYQTADEAGNIYVAYSHARDSASKEIGVYLSRRTVEGRWLPPVEIGIANGTNFFPWISAGREGHLGFAFYHTDAGASRAAQADATWHIIGGASVDAMAPAPHFQFQLVDPEPVLRGPGMYLPDEEALLRPGYLDRFDYFLGDFLETRIGPDGRLAVAYAQKENGQIVNRFAYADGSLDLSRHAYLNGPLAS